MFLSLSAFVVACKKDKTEDTPSSQPKTGIVTCKVDGKDWESNERSAIVPFLDSSIASVGANIEGDTFNLIAIKTKSGDSSMIMMNALLSSTRTGTYNMTGSDYNIFYINGIDALSLLSVFFGYTASSSLTITKFDVANKKVSGTFNTTMTSTSSGPTITVTNGSFTDVYLDNQ